ncbi:MAG: hypothetical protein QXP01_08065 [Candidatus Hadarchaeum sp.]
MIGRGKIHKAVVYIMATMMLTSLVLTVTVLAAPMPTSAASTRPKPLIYIDCSRVEKGWCGGCGAEKAVYTRYCRYCLPSGCYAWWQAGQWCDYC